MLTLGLSKLCEESFHARGDVSEDWVPLLRKAARCADPRLRPTTRAVCGLAEGHGGFPQHSMAGGHREPCHWLAAAPKAALEGKPKCPLCSALAPEEEEWSFALICGWDRTGALWNLGGCRFPQLHKLPVVWTRGDNRTELLPLCPNQVCQDVEQRASLGHSACCWEGNRAGQAPWKVWRCDGVMCQCFSWGTEDSMACLSCSKNHTAQPGAHSSRWLCMLAHWGGVWNGRGELAVTTCCRQGQSQDKGRTKKMGKESFLK